jgi:nucleotide-binding universal stress UspA family protein
VTALRGPIVCGVDFSAGSRRALVRAHALARQLGLPLTVVSAIDPLLAEAAIARFGPGQFAGRATRDLQAFIEEAVGKTKAEGPTTSAATPVGNAAKELLEAGDAAGASMIVVGTEGLGRTRRFMFGSTTLRVIRAAERPVLAVPPPGDGADASDASARSFTQILCGVDFGDPSIAAARAAVDLGRALDVPVQLLNAVAGLTLPSIWDIMLAPGDEARAAAAREKLRALAATLGTPAPAVAAEVGEADDVFGREVVRGGTALVVLGLGDAAGHRPGSTALRIMAETRVPVLVVPT